MASVPELKDLPALLRQVSRKGGPSQTLQREDQVSVGFDQKEKKTSPNLVLLLLLLFCCCRLLEVAEDWRPRVFQGPDFVKQVPAEELLREIKKLSHGSTSSYDESNEHSTTSSRTDSDSSSDDEQPSPPGSPIAPKMISPQEKSLSPYSKPFVPEEKRTAAPNVSSPPANANRHYSSPPYPPSIISPPPPPYGYPPYGMPYLPYYGPPYYQQLPNMPFNQSTPPHSHPYPYHHPHPHTSMPFSPPPRDGFSGYETFGQFHSFHQRTFAGDAPLGWFPPPYSGGPGPFFPYGTSSPSFFLYDTEALPRYAATQNELLVDEDDFSSIGNLHLNDAEEWPAVSTPVYRSGLRGSTRGGGNGRGRGRGMAVEQERGLKVSDFVTPPARTERMKPRIGKTRRRLATEDASQDGQEW